MNAQENDPNGKTYSTLDKRSFGEQPVTLKNVGKLSLLLISIVAIGAIVMLIADSWNSRHGRTPEDYARNMYAWESLKREGASLSRSDVIKKMGREPERIVTQVGADNVSGYGYSAGPLKAGQVDMWWPVADDKSVGIRFSEGKAVSAISNEPTPNH